MTTIEMATVTRCRKERLGERYTAKSHAGGRCITVNDEMWPNYSKHAGNQACVGTGEKFL